MSGTVFTFEPGAMGALIRLMVGKCLSMKPE